MPRSKGKAGQKAVKRHPFFAVFRALFRLGFPKHRVVGLNPVPADKPAVFVCNHAGIYGPIAMAACFKRRFRPWVKSKTCFIKTARTQIQHDLFGKKTGAVRVLCRIVSVLIAPITVAIMIGVGAIPVYGDVRIVTTFRESVHTLQAGVNLVVFPENAEPNSKYTNGFRSGFVHIGRRFCEETGERLTFYPVYVSKKTRTICVGEPVAYLPEYDSGAERARVADTLRDRITRIARELEEGG